MQHLWLQDKLADKSLTAGNILGPENPADLMTKRLTREIIDRHLKKLSCRTATGRSDIAPSLVATICEANRAEVKNKDMLSDSTSRKPLGRGGVLDVGHVILPMWHVEQVKYCKHNHMYQTSLSRSLGPLQAGLIRWNSGYGEGGKAGPASPTQSAIITNCDDGRALRQLADVMREPRILYILADSAMGRAGGFFVQPRRCCQQDPKFPKENWQ